MEGEAVTLCVYGPKIGYSSLEVVTRGMIEAAIEHGVFEGYVPTGRSYDEHDLYRGRDAAWAVFCGGYPDMPVLSYGTHRYKAAMLAANSSWIPEAFWTLAYHNLKEILTPSEWSKQQIEEARPKTRESGLGVRVVPHGVLPGFKPIGEGEVPRVNVAAPPGKFVITHFAGSSEERKGSMELVRAFMSWPKHNDAFLFLCMNSNQSYAFQAKVRDRYTEEETRNCLAVVPHLNAEPDVMRWVYLASDLVCQPSRAEGYGMVCPEALCCGTPVAITTATGHLQWCMDGDSKCHAGIVPIEVGAPRRVSYDSGGMAPFVSVEAIQVALDKSFTDIEFLRKEAAMLADARREKWSWANQTKSWISDLKEMYPHD